MRGVKTGRGRRWAAMRLQHRSRPIPLGAMKLGWLCRDAPIKVRRAESLHPRDQPLDAAAFGKEMGLEKMALFSPGNSCRRIQVRDASCQSPGQYPDSRHPLWSPFCPIRVHLLCVNSGSSSPRIPQGRSHAWMLQLVLTAPQTHIVSSPVHAKFSSLLARTSANFGCLPFC